MPIVSIKIANKESKKTIVTDGEKNQVKYRHSICDMTVVKLLNLHLWLPIVDKLSHNINNNRNDSDN